MGLKPREQTWEQQRPAGASETEGGEEASNETSEQASESIPEQQAEGRACPSLQGGCNCSSSSPSPRLFCVVVVLPDQLQPRPSAREEQGAKGRSGGERACMLLAPLPGAGRICRRAAGGAVLTALDRPRGRGI